MFKSIKIASMSTAANYRAARLTQTPPDLNGASPAIISGRAIRHHQVQHLFVTVFGSQIAFNIQLVHRLRLQIYASGLTSFDHVLLVVVRAHAVAKRLCSIALQLNGQIRHQKCNLYSTSVITPCNYATSLTINVLRHWAINHLSRGYQRIVINVRAAFCDHTSARMHGDECVPLGR